MIAVLGKASLAGITFALLLLISASVFAGDKAKQEAATWMPKAIELSGIEIAGSTPFRLRVRFHFLNTPADAGDGTYELVWASPDQWRREITFPGYSEIVVGGKDKEWRVRNVSYRPMRVQQLDALLAGVLTLRSESGEVVRKVREEKLDGVPARCAQMSAPRPSGGPALEWERCFESATGLLLRTATQPTVRQYSDYQPILGKQFPFRMVLLEGGKPAVDARWPYPRFDGGSVRRPGF